VSYDITVHPQPLGVDVDVTDPVELAGTVKLDGIPNTYHINLDKIAKITLGVDPLTIEPLDVAVRLKEFPSIRAHVPANYSVGVSLLGLQLFCIRLCGEAQVITEPYHPNPCELCGASQPTPTIVGTTPVVTTKPPG
jgi:hypothetical protein